MAPPDGRIERRTSEQSESHEHDESRSFSSHMTAETPLVEPRVRSQDCAGSFFASLAERCFWVTPDMDTTHERTLRSCAVPLRLPLDR